MKSFIVEYHNQLLKNEIKILDLISKSHQIYEKNKKCNDLITECYEKAVAEAFVKQEQINQNVENLLFGLPYSLKDNIVTLGTRTTGGSKFLKDFIPKYDSTIHQLLNQSGATLIGKTNLDEFGMGGTGLNSYFGKVLNYHDNQRIVGGSTAGSANQVANGSVLFSVCSDTGDSIRYPASLTGIVGYKPTYGLISRYGVLPYAPSLDCVGIMAKSVQDCAIVANYINKFDEKDFTSQKLINTDYFNNLQTVKSAQINLLKNVEKYLGVKEKKAYLTMIEILKKNNFEVSYVDLSKNFIEAIDVVYSIICYSESSSCYRNFSGINFGLNHGGETYQELITKNRSDGLGLNVKIRMVIGHLFTNKKNFEDLFIKAKKVRTLLIDKYMQILNSCDFFLIPSSASVAPLISDNPKPTVINNLLKLANLTGAPSISIPLIKIDSLPFGININCAPFKDQSVLNYAYTLQEIFDKEGFYE